MSTGGIPCGGGNPMFGLLKINIISKIDACWNIERKKNKEKNKGYENRFLVLQYNN